MENNTNSSEMTDWNKVMKTLLYTDMEVYSIYIFVPIVVFIGIVGNVSTIIVLTTNARMHNSLNIYLVNLAICDCLFLLIAPIFMWVTVAESPLHLYYDNSWFSVEYCKFNMFAVDSTYQLSATLTMAISVERFLAITKPLKYRAYVSKKRTLKICFAIWCIILLYQSRNAVTTQKLLIEFPWPDMTNGVPNSTTICVICVGSCTVMKNLFLLDVCLSLLYLVLMIPMYGMIFCSLREPFTKSKKDTSAASNRTNYERKALRTVIITVSVYVLFTAPLNVIYIVFHFGYVNEDIFILFANTFRFLAFINSAVNPIIYNVSNDAYRAAFMALFVCPSAKKAKANRNAQHRQPASVITVSSALSTDM